MNYQEHDHNPNPFDFVPFNENGPYLRTPEEFDTEFGDLLSGYLEVKIKALTPVHIIGKQMPGTKSGRSFMFRQGGKACIPAATIRGCLRAFIETLTNGWVSQANEEYPKVFRQRHVGFRTFKHYVNRGKRMKRTSPPAVNPDFEPQIRRDNKIDLASYLFGMVVEPESAQDTLHEALARKSKIWIEDASIDDANLTGGNKYWVPDIKHPSQDSFMGGAKPCASNWWYLRPAEVWKRQTYGHTLAEFIGDKFWGRKFYYHQDPAKCTHFYHPDQANWHYASKRPFYPIHLECLEPGKHTARFRIYLDKVPENLAKLFLCVLMPGQNIRHKLGYGKAYGYGSITFSVDKALFRTDAESRGPQPLSKLTEISDWQDYAWDRTKLAEIKLANPVIDWQALDALARVLGWFPDDDLCFTYPFFQKHFFMQPVSFEQFRHASGNRQAPFQTEVKPDEGANIARKLSSFKKSIHFKQYQKTATGSHSIENRQP